LMKDQVENLRKKNITAYSIYSGMSRKEVINVLKIACNSNCKFLYVSPERLETALFKEFLPGMNVSLIAVDEAHCISQWGYDFRPPYLRIAALREELPGIPVLALTASATKEVQKDICEKLTTAAVNRFKAKDESKWQVFLQSFERANLSYSVFKVDSKINKIAEILRNVNGSAIVYCKSRRRTKEISELLKMHGMTADFYHAGLAQEARNKKQEDWIDDKTRVIVCTNAFGMGIDKPNVRAVIHADPPDCLENYYQEAGRAGRDGKKSYAVLLHDENDLKEMEGMAAIRFPSVEEIKKVYQAVCNYLQVPSGSGEGQYFDLDLNDLIKKFKLNSYTTIYSLKCLEQEGWLSFNEQVFIQSSVQFICNKESLYQFEKDYPQLEPLVKSLLRTWGGIFDHPVSISENILSGLLRKEILQVKKELLQLHIARVIDYSAQKDSPQVLFLRNRIKTEDLTVNRLDLEKRKEGFEKRVKTMTQFIRATTECRSGFIAAYFGDDKVNDCGICDNCLRQKSASLSQDEFKNINEKIVSLVTNKPVEANELIRHLKGIKKEKAWKVIHFLQAENKIDLDSSGRIKLK
jgi:ATP-dependent DNA helicase RecQ